MKIVYFAHPIVHYDKDIEIECMHIIFTMLMPIANDKVITDFESQEPEFEIMNPNQKWLSKVYQNRKDENHPDPFGIFKEITAACDIVVGCTFFDGTIGAGVGSEMKTGLEKGKEVYIIFLDDNKKFFMPISSLDNFKVLTVEETKKKIKKGEM